MSGRFFPLSLASALLLGACGSSSNSPPVGSSYHCSALDAGTTCVADAGTYETVQPILAKSCLPACHDGSPDAAWPLTDPDDIQAWTSFVDQDLRRCSMPPLGQPLTIDDDGRRAILNWLACGGPH